MSKNITEIKKIIKNELDTAYTLPHDYSVARLQANAYGVTPIDGYRTYPVDLATESEKHSTTGRYGFDVDGTREAFWPHYVKNYNLTSTSEILDRIMVSSTLELETYAVSLDSRLGSSVIDLKSLMTEDGKPVFTVRFDEILRACGYKEAFPDLHSFVDVQNFINNEKVNSILTPRAIVQVVLQSYFIPTAIGETDPNSRNILLADYGLDKFDVVFRIDAESNTYLRDMYRERSGRKSVPKGIYSANEDFETEFLPNIKAKTLIGRPKIDWELFDGFLTLTENLLTNSYLDNLIYQGYRLNQFRYQPSPFARQIVSPYTQRLSIESYTDFTTKTQERTKNFIKNVRNALGYTSTKFPFDLNFGSEKPGQFKPILKTSDGTPIDEKGNFVDISSLEREL